MSTDVLVFLAWVAGPGVAAISAWLLERLGAVQELSSTGKAIVAVLVATVCGVLATAAGQYFAGNESALTAFQPYANVLIPALSILVQQFTHGAQKLRAQR